MSALLCAPADPLAELDAEVWKHFDSWTTHRARCRDCSRGAVTLGGDELRCANGQPLHDRWWTREGDLARARVAGELLSKGTNT